MIETYHLTFLKYRNGNNTNSTLQHKKNQGSSETVAVLILKMRISAIMKLKVSNLIIFNF